MLALVHAHTHASTYVIWINCEKIVQIHINRRMSTESSAYVTLCDVDITSHVFNASLALAILNHSISNFKPQVTYQAANVIIENTRKSVRTSLLRQVLYVNVCASLRACILRAYACMMFYIRVYLCRD